MRTIQNLVDARAIFDRHALAALAEMRQAGLLAPDADSPANAAALGASMLSAICYPTPGMEAPSVLWARPSVAQRASGREVRAIPGVPPYAERARDRLRFTSS